MKTIKHSLGICISISILLVYCGTVFGADKPVKQPAKRPAKSPDSALRSEQKNKAMGWERAAMSREWAGLATLEQAELLVKKASSYRVLETTNKVTRVKNLVSSARTDLAAAAKYSAAISNYDAAKLDWKKAADIYSKLGDTKDSKRVLARSKDAHDKGTELCELAAHCAERAIEAYGPDGADDLNMMAAASQQAATWWEKLASR